MTNQQSPLVDYLLANPHWPMKSDVLDQLLQIVARHVDGVKLSAEEVRAATAGKTGKGPDQGEFQLVDSTAIIPITGIVAKYSRMVNGSSQPRGTSVEMIGRQLEEAVRDNRVEGIFLHIESPGGMIDGVADLADAIYAADMIKPVTAFADDLAASGAYWLGSQASAFYASQSATVGSIGVYSVFIDASRMAEDRGLKFQVIGSGQMKGAGYPGTSLTDGQLKVIRENLEVQFSLFVAQVVRGRRDRGLTEDFIRGAEGRVWIGQRAKELGLVDGIKTLRQAVKRATARTTGRGATVLEPEAKGTKTMNDTNDDQVDQVTPAQPAKVEEKAGGGKAEATASAAGIREEATQAERERTASIHDVLGREFPDQYQAACKDGLSLDAAKALAFDEACRQRDEAREKWQTMTKALAGRGIKAEDFADLQGADEDPEKAPDKPAADSAEAYMARVLELEEGGLAKGKAYHQATSEMPKAHDAWLAGNTGNATEPK